MTEHQELKKKTRRGRKKGDSLIGKRVLNFLSASAQALGGFGEFVYNPYPYLYSSLGHVYDRETINSAVSNLVERGLVEEDADRGLRIAPTGAGVKEKLYRERNRSWDGNWRVVFFDIPEVRRNVRDGLRLELKKLGFGLWQRSAWITPFDIAEELSSYLRKQHLSEVVQIVVGERISGLSDREFAAKIWSLDDLNEKYTRLLVEWGRELKKESRAEERITVATKLHNGYLGILVADPRLPSELLPANWVGEDARELFKKLKSILTVDKPF